MDESFIVDNSIVMSWCFKDETNSLADAVLDRLSDATALVPSIWPLEVVNLLLVAERKKRLSEADSVRFITLLSRLPILVEQDPSDRIMMDLLGLARAHDLSSYDASYLDLCMRRGLPMATLDARLAEAAKKVDVQVLFD